MLIIQCYLFLCLLFISVYSNKIKQLVENFFCHYIVLHICTFIILILFNAINFLKQRKKNILFQYSALGRSEKQKIFTSVSRKNNYKIFLLFLQLITYKIAL